MCEREILRPVDRYGKDTIVAAMAEVQDYVESIVRHRVAERSTARGRPPTTSTPTPAAGRGSSRST